MCKRTTAILTAALLAVGCDHKAEPLPEPATLRSYLQPDGGFAVRPRPDCTADVTRAASDLEPDAIARVASQGGTFTCGRNSEPLPLDTAVDHDAPAAVLAMLKAGADPNARWSSRGDRFPLQEAIDARIYQRPAVHREEIIRMLLQHGADPNMRWCPFETRGNWEGNLAPPCTSDKGVTPLIMATLLDEPSVTSLLVKAKANPELEDWYGANALDYVRSEGVLVSLQPAFFREKPSRADVLRYLNRRHDGPTFSGPFPGPWDETPLTRAICCAGSWALPPPPPGITRTDERVRLLLGLGADPNRRLTWGGVDWTPLGLALFHRDLRDVEALLVAGADPNTRWCVPLRSSRQTKGSMAQPGCDSNTGTTPLMLAASLGSVGAVELLLRHGANRTLTDWQGRTAAQYATGQPGPRIKGLLE